MLLRAGLPEPDLNVDIHAADGRFVARVDLAYSALHIAIEYDGRGHAEDSAQFRRDADRWDDIREQGWDLVRILSHHLEDDGASAVAKVRAALRRAGVSEPPTQALLTGSCLKNAPLSLGLGVRSRKHG